MIFVRDVAHRHNVELLAGAVQAKVAKRKMQPMKAKEDAGRILTSVYGHVDAFRARPPRPTEQFAAAGLMRCCALLKGILVLDEASLPVVASILARQHWETWVVSLYVLLGGEEALQVIVDNDTYSKRRLSKLWPKLDVDRPDLDERPPRLKYEQLHDRVLELLREQGESVDGPAGVTGYDVTYTCESLFSVHANGETIDRQHLVKGDDYWAVSVDSSLTPGDVVEGPMLYTSHLAQHVFEKFGLAVAGLVVPARAQVTHGLSARVEKNQKRVAGPAGASSSGPTPT